MRYYNHDMQRENERQKTYKNLLICIYRVRTFAHSTKQKDMTMETFTIKIAPDLEEITRENNVFSCEFNNKKIRWCIAYDCNNLSEENETNLKRWLQNAIALSSKSWQIVYFLNNNGLPFSSDIFINGYKVEYK